MSKLRFCVPLLVVASCLLDCSADRQSLSGGLGQDATGSGGSPSSTGGAAGSDGTLGMAGNGGSNGGASGSGYSGSRGANDAGSSGTTGSGAGGAAASSGGALGAAGSLSSAGVNAGGTSAAGSGSGGQSAAGAGGATTSVGGVSGTGTSTAGAGGASVTLLPFAVDTYFSATGVLGDAGSVQLQAGMGNCRPNAMASAGQCWRVDSKGATSPSGYLWRYPADNTGQSLGLRIEAGAKQLLLSATGDKGGEQVTFFVGGAGTTATAYRDTFRVERVVTLTTSAQTVTLDLSAVTYTNVIGGFGFTVAPGTDSVRFFLSGIQWTK